MEFTPNSYSSQCPGATIYRLGAQMSVRQNIPGHLPNGGHRPNGRTFAASNFLIRHSSVRTMGDERPDGYSSTRDFHICNARVRTMIGSRSDG